MEPVALFKCLAEQTRLQCLMIMRARGEVCVCELMAALDQDQPKISRHLAQLRSCELVQTKRSGKWVYYRIHDALEQWAAHILDNTLASNSEIISTPLVRLKQHSQLPCCD